jgi:peptidoglycan/xylan/chitin deacetylase (PgdA/CDA1 family)
MMEAEAMRTWAQTCFERVILVTRRTAGLLILAYHQIGDQGLPGQVTARRFGEHLEFLKGAFRLVSLSDGLHSLGYPSPGHRPAVAITFDDGYRDSYLKAFPLLLQHRAPATIFVATGLVATGTYKGQPMLTTAQIREMADYGVAFGAHTVSHQILSSLSPQAAEAEIAVSKAQIEHITGRRATAFAYPNGRVGDFTDASVAAVRACGFHSAATTIHGANPPEQDRFRLRRIGLGDWTPAELALRMSGLVDLPIVAKQTVQAFVGQWRRERHAREVQ